EWLAVRHVDVTDQPGGGVAILLPGDQRVGVAIGHQEHIALGDAGKAGDRRAVEPDAVGQGLADLTLRNGDVLDDAHDVGELQADELDAILIEPRLDLHDAGGGTGVGGDSHRPQSSLLARWSARARPPATPPVSSRDIRLVPTKPKIRAPARGTCSATNP